MNARYLVSAVIITVCCGSPAPVRAQSRDAHASSSFSAVNVSREHRYQVDARVAAAAVLDSQVERR